MKKNAMTKFHRKSFQAKRTFGVKMKKTMTDFCQKKLEKTR